MIQVTIEQDSKAFFIFMELLVEFIVRCLITELAKSSVLSNT